MYKRIGVVAFAALMALGAAAVLQAMPIIGTGYDNFYYSDATFTTQVGERYRDCDDMRSNWGDQTQFVDSYEWSCEDFRQIIGECPSGMYFCTLVNVNNPGDLSACNCV